MKRRSIIVAITVALLGKTASAEPQPLYLDPTQPIDKRVDDLISRMTLEEKAQELDHKTSGIKRLNIPEWGGWNQCLHGIWSNSRTTTLFPVSIAMAASWDPALVNEETTAISDEGRAMFNIHEQGPSTPCGLVYRGPVINISRNPRWGRIQECYGEDPSKLKSVAVIGPAAEHPEYGNYYHYNIVQRKVTPLEGLKNRLGDKVEIRSAAGCGMLPGKTDEDDIAKAVEAAKGADVAIVYVGTNLKIEAEDKDRKDLFLPGAQEKLIEAVYAANPKTVVVLMNAGPLSTKWARDHVPAMLEAWYAGEEGGNAIADVLLGNVNPGGRLPYTVYESASDVPRDNDYDITHGYTYMYFDKEPVFPFGHGLSYTSFNYGPLKVSSQKVAPDGKLTVSTEVTNSGSRAGDEVVQFYGHQRVCSVKQPNQKLVAFERVHLNPGESRTVTAEVPADRMAIYDEKIHKFVVEPGIFDLMAGSSSKEIHSRAEYEVTK